MRKKCKCGADFTKTGVLIRPRSRFIPVTLVGEGEVTLQAKFPIYGNVDVTPTGEITSEEAICPLCKQSLDLQDTPIRVKEQQTFDNDE